MLRAATVTLVAFKTLSPLDRRVSCKYILQSPHIELGTRWPQHTVEVHTVLSASAIALDLVTANCKRTSKASCVAECVRWAREREREREREHF